MREIDYTMPIFVSGVFTLLLFVFYLYKSENSKVMHFLLRLRKNRHGHAKIKKDTRKHDALMLVILMILISAFSLKFIQFAVIISDSMKPEFARGDLVLTQSLFKEPEKGDIVMFTASGVQNPLTHRVMDVRGDLVTTKGDNSPIFDDYGTTKSDILAKVVEINGKPAVIKSVGSYFILDFSKEGKLYKYGDQFTFLQNMFLTIRTWGYVITAISLIALIMSMLGGRR